MRHRSSATPELSSVADTVTGIGVGLQPEGAVVVVSVGGVTSPLTASIEKLSVRQPDALPAASITRVRSVCGPLPDTVTWSPGSPDSTSPPSIRHSTVSMPESSSVPVTATWYGFGAGPAASAIAIVSVFNVFATLVMPVLGAVALLASGVVEGRYLLLAGIGILAVAAAVVVFAVVLRSEAGARAVGSWGDRLVGPLMRRFAAGRSLDLTGKILDFRSSVVGVMRTRWLLVTLSTLLLQLTSWAILVIALRGLEVGAGAAKVTWTEALAAFSFARVASFIPITPGGLGTVDAALAALLTGFGATSSQALAADLVWRAASYVPQVVLGALTFLWWRVTAARRRQRLAADLPSRESPDLTREG